jgi:hypothetical protein
VNYPSIVLSEPDAPLLLPFSNKPFSVLFDMRTREWFDSEWINLNTTKLLDAGCCFFVCFGSGSEYVHDKIDDIISKNKQLDVLTTFHENETLEEALNFFLVVALEKTGFGLLITHNQYEWRAVLNNMEENS